MPSPEAFQTHGSPALDCRGHGDWLLDLEKSPRTHYMSLPPDRCAPIEIFPILPCRRLAVLSAQSPKNRYLSTLLILLPMQPARQRAETAHFTACETQGRCSNRKSNHQLLH